MSADSDLQLSVIAGKEELGALLRVLVPPIYIVVLYIYIEIIP
jgi:hypothetical protein